MDNIVNTIEDIKQKISSSEYKTLLDNLKVVHDKKEYDNLYEVTYYDQEPKLEKEGSMYLYRICPVKKTTICKIGNSIRDCPFWNDNIYTFFNEYKHVISVVKNNHTNTPLLKYGHPDDRYLEATNTDDLYACDENEDICVHTVVRVYQIMISIKKYDPDQ